MSTRKICDGFTLNATYVPHTDGMKEAEYGVSIKAQADVYGYDNKDLCTGCFQTLLHYWETGGFGTGSQVTITRD